MTAVSDGSNTADWSELLELATFQGGFNATIVTVGTTMLGIAAGVVGVFALLRRGQRFGVFGIGVRPSGRAR